MYLNDSKKGYKKNQVFLPFHLENHINHLQIFKSVYTLGVILFSPRRTSMISRRITRKTMCASFFTTFNSLNPYNTQLVIFFYSCRKSIPKKGNEKGNIKTKTSSFYTLKPLKNLLILLNIKLTFKVMNRPHQLFKINDISLTRI